VTGPLSADPPRAWPGTPRQKLIFLQVHWGDCYDISAGGGRWRAARPGPPPVVLEAGSAETLIELIKADWRGAAP
jgi:hypothetical protein